MDGYEFHYPQELSPDNLDEVRSALGDHDIYCIASGPAPRPAVRQGRARVARRRPRARRPGASRATPPTSPARSAPTSSSGPGSRATTTRSRRPYADSWRWLIEGIGEAAEVCDGHGVKLFLEHKNSEPAMKILMRNIGMTLHVIHKLRAEGVDERAGEHGLAAPAHERRAPAGVRGAARRRGAARPPARQLRLGHLRRRQHGRRHGVHGDRRARAGAAPRRATATTASGSASTSTRTPRTRWRPCAARSSSGTSSTAWPRASTTPALREAQSEKDAVRAYELVYAALGA